MNADVLKRAGQGIVVNTDMFSAYTTTCVANSERAEDLGKALIQVSTPIRRSQHIIIRVDKAPGFISLASNQNHMLQQVGIELELTCDENKNANCHVDKIINELEVELKKISPDGEKIDSGVLAQATMILNNKVRKRGFSAAEIHFSRDSHDNSNLHLCDDKLLEKQQDLRTQNRNYSKLSFNKPSTSSKDDLVKGDLVYTQNSGSKHVSKDPHLVIGKNENGKMLLRKAIHASPFASKSTTISPITKTVARKFIVKPEHQYKNDNCQVNLNDDQTFIDITSVPQLSWDPTSPDDDLQLLQVLSQSAHEEETAPVTPTNSTDNSYYEEESTPVTPTTNSPSPQSPSTSGDHHQASCYPTDSQTGSDTTTGTSESESPVILILEDDDPRHDLREKLLQDRKPKKGDLISYYNDRLKTWVNAKITRDLTRTWRCYYNIEYSNGEQDGLYLKPDSRWTFLTDSKGNVLLPGRTRSETAPPSLHPTPASSPSRDTDPLHSPANTSFLSTPSAALSTSLSVASSIGVLDRCMHESMEWDATYDSLLLSSESTPQPGYTVSLDRVNNLDHVLPISSTPVPTSHRVSKLRQPLPLERNPDEAKSPGFLGRLFRFMK